jgi:hypothetical protein
MKGGLEDIRVLDVAPLRAKGPGGANGERAAPLRIQQSAKEGGALEPRPAQPLDCAVPRDERGRSAIADESVIPDLPIGLVFVE